VPQTDTGSSLSNNKHHLNLLRLALLITIYKPNANLELTKPIRLKLFPLTQTALKIAFEVPYPINPAAHAWLNLGKPLTRIEENQGSKIESNELKRAANAIERFTDMMPNDVSEGHEELFENSFENNFEDINFLLKSKSPNDIFSKPLFYQKWMHNKTKPYWDNFNNPSQYGPEWQFWRDWYQGFLDGKPLDWDLQREVALIPDKDWDKGPEHIAQKIEDIKAEILTDIAPLAEDMSFNEQTGKFYVKSRPIRKPDLLSTTLEKASDALDDALDAKTNGLMPESREARVLRRCLKKYTHNPERIEMDFVDVYAGLTRQITSGELPDSEEITSLQETLKSGALDIRANHPEIAKNREKRAEQALNELTPTQKEQLETAQPILQALTEGEAHDDFEHDIPSLINDAIGPLPEGAPPLGPAIRTFNRAAEISIWLRTKNLALKIDASPEWKMVKILGTLSGFIALGLTILGVI